MKKRRIKKHSIKKWEVSFIEFKDNKRKKFKITRRIPELTVAETKIFKSKHQALKKFKEWLK